MDTPKPVAPRRGGRVVAVVTIVVLVALAAWFAYKMFLTPKRMTVEQQKQLIIDQVMSAPPLPDNLKAVVMQESAAEQKQAQKQPGLTDAQKAAIIQSVAVEGK